TLKKQDPDLKTPRAVQLNAEMEKVSDFVLPTTFVNAAILRNTRLPEIRRAIEASSGYTFVDARRYMDVNRVVRTLDAYMEREEAIRRAEAVKQAQEKGE